MKPPIERHPYSGHAFLVTLAFFVILVLAVTVMSL